MQTGLFLSHAPPRETQETMSPRTSNERIDTCSRIASGVGEHEYFLSKRRRFKVSINTRLSRGENCSPGVGGVITRVRTRNVERCYQLSARTRGNGDWASMEREGTIVFRCISSDNAHRQNTVAICDFLGLFSTCPCRFTR